MEVKTHKYWPLALIGFFLVYFGSSNDAFSLNLASKGSYLTLASNTFIFNPRSLTWKAVKNGKVIRSGKASGGSKYCKDVRRACRTPSGTYRIISKGSASCRSSKYPLPNGGAKMPYCMFFSKNYAIMALMMYQITMPAMDASA